MAFPSVGAVGVTNGTTASATPTLNYPATVAAGDLLLCIVRIAVSGAIGWPGGFNEILDTTATDQVGMAWAVASGSEDGGTFGLTSGNGKYAAVTYAIGGADTTNAPTFTTNTGNSNAVEPPLHDAGTSKDYLWLAVGTVEGEQSLTPSSDPTNYTNRQVANSGTGGAITTNVRVYSYERQLTASSENPNTIILDAADDFLAMTVAVAPAPAATPSFAPRRRVSGSNMPLGPEVGW